MTGTSAPSESNSPHEPYLATQSAPAPPPVLIFSKYPTPVIPKFDSPLIGGSILELPAAERAESAGAHFVPFLRAPQYETSRHPLTFWREPCDHADGRNALAVHRIPREREFG